MKTSKLQKDAHNEAYKFGEDVNQCTILLKNTRSRNVKTGVGIYTSNLGKEGRKSEEYTESLSLIYRVLFLTTIKQNEGEGVSLVVQR